MSEMDLFKTRARANEGKRLALYAPDGGKTEHWLQVRHVWSDAFQIAQDDELAKLKDALLAAGGDEAAVSDMRRESQVRLLSALVCAWSFETECTPDAVAAFLAEAPQIVVQLDKFAADSRSFFGNGSASSNAGSSPNAS